VWLWSSTAAPRTACPTGSSSTRWSKPLSLTRFLAAAALIAAQPAWSQDATLEDLIPDSAVTDPEAWAAQGVPAEAQAEEAAGPVIEPDAPLAEMPLVTVPWPDAVELPALTELAPEEDIVFPELDAQFAPLALEGSQERVSEDVMLVFPSDLSLFPQRDEFITRFKQLSTIEEYDDEDGNADNLAQLAARARADEDMLNRLLRVYGYYDALVLRTVGGDENEAPVRFDVVPGTQYKFGAIDLGALESAGLDYVVLRNNFEIRTGDPLLSDKIVEERYDLDEALGENGYPFAAIEDPALLVDHAREEGDLTMITTPNGKFRFGQVVSALPDFLSSAHLANIARFSPGDVYKRSDELDLRRAILATGLVSSVTITRVRTAEPAGEEPGTVDMRIDMEPAPLRTVAGAIGYGTGEGFRAEASWEHRNLFPPEGMLRVRGIAGTREQLAGVTFRRNNLGARDRILTIDAYATKQNREAYESRTAALSGTYERVSTLLFQKPFTWSVGLEAIATRERETTIDNVAGPPETYFIGALPVRAQIDNTFDLLDPTYGWRLGGRVSPEISFNSGEQYTYVRAQLDASAYYPIAKKVVIAGRVRFGSMPGAPLSAIAPSRRFYAGGGGSVRGYGYQAIGPRDDLGEPSGGRSLTEVALEARIGTGFFGGALEVVPFVDAGAVDTEPYPDFQDIKIGAGVGVRYKTGFGPIRVDVGVPLTPGPGDPPVAVYVALGQAF
jgi:translocation and assembly module TamA